MSGPFDTLFMVTIYWVGLEEKSVSYGTDKVFPDLNFKVNLAFDQSSTQTGIAVADENGKLIGVLDIMNLGLPNADTYIRMLRKWINNNFANLDIGYIICERAEQNAHQMYVKKILQKLIAVLEDFAVDCNNVCYQIDNKTWKKHFLKEDKFHGRRVKTEYVKVAVVEKATDLYPDLQFYYRFMKSTDSADAVGIMYGFIDEVFVNGFKSNMKVCTIMPTAPRRKFSMQFVTLEEFKELVKERPSEYRKLKVVAYNDAMTFEDNARRIINFFDDGAILYTENDKSRMVWKFTADRELTPQHVVIIKRG